MSGHLNVGGSWKELKSAYCNINGEWKEIKSGYANVGGSWKEIFSSSPSGVYGFRIAIEESDTSTRVTYPETLFGMPNLAYGKTPASGTGENCMNDWDGCPLISGIHRQLGNATGGWTDIANDAAWQAGSGSNDMMTYVPTWYMKMTNDGTNIDCAFSKEQIDDTWMDYAGSVGSSRVGHFRVGCFGGYIYYAKIYSRGSVAPTAKSISPKDLLSYAKARGTGYDIMTWYQWTYLTALAVLLYKSTNLQTAMANGVYDSSGVQSETSLIWSNPYGMAGSNDSNTEQMSFFWIQNLWGNAYQFVGGILTDSDGRLMTCTGYSSYSESDFDKTALTSPLSSTLSGYISKVTGTTETGFFPVECAGSSSTYFPDYGYVVASYALYVGGTSQLINQIGPFLISCKYPPGHSNYNRHIVRLSYRL